MTKVSDVLAERFRQNPLEIHVCKQHPPGGWVDKLPLLCQDFSKSKSIQANSNRESKR